MPERHVLFIVSDFAPLPSIGRIRTQKMCRYLPEFGWRVSVLTMHPPRDVSVDERLLAEIPDTTTVHRVPWPQPFEVPPRVAGRLIHKRRTSSGPAVAGTEVSGNPPKGGAGNSWVESASRVADRAKTWANRHLLIPDAAATALPCLTHTASKLLRTSFFDAVVASVPAFSPWLAAAVASRRTGTPLIVDYRDLWHRDVLRAWIGPVRRRLELSLERWALAHTDAVVTVTEGKTQRVRSLDTKPHRRSYRTIYNGFDPDDVAGVEPIRLAEDTGRLVLLHAGKLYGNRRIDPLVEAITGLVESGRIQADQLRLRLLGHVSEDQARRIDAIARRAGNSDLIRFDGYVTRSEAIARQLAADALVVVVDPGETSSGVVPGKLTEYLGLGHFVLAVCPDGEAQDMLQRYGHAAYASAENPEGLEKALLATHRRWRTGNLQACSPGTVVPTRRQNAADLADLLDTLVHAKRVRASARSKEYEASATAVPMVGP